VTSWKKSAFKAIGIDTPIEHDQRYLQADEYLRVLYKLWESSWAPDAIIEDVANDSYIDPDKVRQINHHGQFYDIEARHIVDPSPQRTPFLFQAGTSAAGSEFAATHAEAVFMTGHSPAVLAPKVAKIRALAAAKGRDPESIKIFCTFTPIIGRTEEEAQEKFAELKKYVSTVGGLVLFSGWSGIDMSTLPLGKVITAEDSKETHKITSLVSSLEHTSDVQPAWTPEAVAEKASIGGFGGFAVGTAAKVADELEKFVSEADIDGFNIGYVTTPGSFEDVVELLVPELRRRGVYSEAPAQDQEGGEYEWTAREKVFGKGQRELREDHTGAGYKYDKYVEEKPFVKPIVAEA
jgi:FMN-dependent oxidoreductase (nitrilotriacetate monooxygenase family)